MQWEQFVLILVVVWAVFISYICARFARRLGNLEKQPPKHTHPGEEILFTTEAKEK